MRVIPRWWKLRRYPKFVCSSKVIQVVAQGFINTEKLPELVICVAYGLMMRCACKIRENKLDHASHAGPYSDATADTYIEQRNVLKYFSFVQKHKYWL
jgi:hypothetical protein